MTFFRKKFPFSRPKFIMTFLKSLTRFLGFSLSFPRFSVSFTMFNVVYDPFITRTTTISEKNPFMTHFFTLCVLSRASDNTTSQHIWETDAWAVPDFKFGGTVPPVPPRSPPLTTLCDDIMTRTISVALLLYPGLELALS